ncbi:hypothetical protein BDD12DRAFT_202048 [Trichophaea hybrida]|nr:hypothetical protein BDD12DRAFT_202048 [Trichophaea hybrida]
MEYFESPSCAGTSKKTLKALQKKINGEICPDKNIGWGLHAREHLSFFRVACSSLFVLIPSLTYIVCWLYFHHGDVQGAFAPPAFIASLYSIILVIPQLFSSRYL